MKSYFYLLVAFLLLHSVTTQAERVDNQPKTLLAIFAHPDDETSVSPILAKYAREGINVRLVIATDGQKGVEPHVNIPAGEPLAKVREQEALCATKTLNIAPPILLKFVDGELSEQKNISKLKQEIARLFSEIKPDVVLTWGPDGGYGHPDHTMLSNVVTAVFQQGGEHWPEMVYYPATPNFLLKKFTKYKSQMGRFFQEQWGTTKEAFLPYRISYKAEDLSRAHKAVFCHKSQFTEARADDLVSFMALGEGIAYFRASHHHTSSPKASLF